VLFVWAVCVTVFMAASVCNSLAVMARLNLVDAKANALRRDLSEVRESFWTLHQSLRDARQEADDCRRELRAREDVDQGLRRVPAGTGPGAGDSPVIRRAASLGASQGPRQPSGSLPTP
jgi:septal ring factor EnvC (AmiA/AmiB activator)